MVGADYSGLGVAGRDLVVCDHLVVGSWIAEPAGWNWHRGGRVGHWGSPPPLRGCEGNGGQPWVSVTPDVGKKRVCGLMGATVGGAFTVSVVAEAAGGDGAKPGT